MESSKKRGPFLWVATVAVFLAASMWFFLPSNSLTWVIPLVVILLVVALLCVLHMPDGSPRERVVGEGWSNVLKFVYDSGDFNDQERFTLKCLEDRVHSPRQKRITRREILNMSQCVLQGVISLLGKGVLVPAERVDVFKLSDKFFETMQRWFRKQEERHGIPRALHRASP